MNRDTICVQSGFTPAMAGRQIPIIQSTTFKYAWQDMSNV